MPSARRPEGGLAPWKLLKPLGAGGMGAVYEAVHQESGARRALKLVLADAADDPIGIERFTREALLVARLRHPNIVRIHDAQLGRHPRYLVLDLERGGSLADRLRRGPLPAQEARRIASRLARAVAYAHEQGVLHRDLKPDNVLFGDGDEPRLTDFGLARGSGQERLTQTGAVLGTPAYMAPEQAMDSRSAAEAADVYGLGGLLYAMLTASPPVAPGASILETLDRVTRVPPRAPRELNPDVPPDLEAICLRALEKDPADRFPSAAAMADALQAPAQEVPGRKPPRLLLVGAALAALLCAALVALRFVGAEPPPARTAPGRQPPAQIEDPPSAAAAWLRPGDQGFLSLTAAEGAVVLSALTRYQAEATPEGDLLLTLEPVRFRIGGLLEARIAPRGEGLSQPTQDLLGTRTVLRVEPEKRRVRWSSGPTVHEGNVAFKRARHSLWGETGVVDTWERWLGFRGALSKPQLDSQGRLVRAVWERDRHWSSVYRVRALPHFGTEARPRRLVHLRSPLGSTETFEEGEIVALNGIDPPPEHPPSELLLEVPRTGRRRTRDIALVRAKGERSGAHSRPWGAFLDLLDDHVYLRLGPPDAGWIPIGWRGGVAWVREESVTQSSPGLVGVITASKNDPLNVRERASASSPRLGYMPAGAVFALTRDPERGLKPHPRFPGAYVAAQGDYLRVPWGSGIGWVKSSRDSEYGSEVYALLTSIGQVRETTTPLPWFDEPPTEPTYPASR